jgi:DNA-binding NarL/FixJ family response regulator
VNASHDGVLVGRDAELRVAEDALAAVRQGCGPGTVLVVGEPGIGKTGFLHHLAANADGVRRLALAGFEVARGIPLGAAAELFEVLRTASPEGASLAGVLRPEAATRGPLEPLRVFEAARAALVAVAPALVVFDDVQWADDSSIALCHYLLRAAAADHTPIGFVFASRPGAHLRGLTRALRDSTGSVAEVSLGPLDRDAGIALVQRMDPLLSEADAAQVHDLAAGSPFWIEVLARRAAPLGDGDDAITQRLDSLHGDQAECLAATVVAARPIGLTDLAGLLAWPRSRVEEATAALADRGLVALSGSRVTIVHDLVRETAYRQLPALERRRLHRRVAEWLEQDPDDDLQLLTEALAHRTVVGVPPVALALRIARSPQWRLLGREGLQQIAAIVDGAPMSDPDVTVLHVELATIAAELGERQMAYDRFVVLSDRLPTPRQRAQAALNAARQAIDLQRSQDAAAMVAAARAIVDDDPWLAIEAAALEHTRRMWVDLDLTGGRLAIEQAVSDARSLVASVGGVDVLDPDARRAYVEVLSAAYDVALTDEDAVEMAVAARERVAATRGLGEVHLVAAAAAARMLWWSGRMQEAATKLGAVLDEARRQVYPALVTDLCHVLAYNHYALGRLDDATLLLDEADRIEARIGDCTRRSVPRIRGGLRHILDASRGDWRRAVDALGAVAAAHTNPHARLGLHQWAGLTAARFGGQAAAELVRAETDAAIADAAVVGCRHCHWDVALSSAESLVRIGDRDAATELLRSWDDAHQRRHSRFDLERAWVHALVVAAQGSGAGVDELDQVVHAARAQGRRMDELWVRIDLGRAQAAGQSGLAVRTWVAALDLAESIGAATEAKVIQRELRRVGARTLARQAEPGRERSTWLTARELEVARLAAGGRRNVEIAEALFLSPKTVERHLSSIFTKLAVRNRAELVARYSADLAAGQSATQT